jgi:hypothetical protein
MAEHIWSVLCYKGCIDKFTDQISLLDVVECLPVPFARSPSEPMKEDLDVQLQLVSLWTRSQLEIPEVTYSRLSLLTSDGVVAECDELEVDLQNRTRIRTFFKMTALPFRGFGLYAFIVERHDGIRDRWKEVARVPLEIRNEPMRPPGI